MELLKSPFKGVCLYWWEWADFVIIDEKMALR
jgi:hypothetical protein